MNSEGTVSIPGLPTSLRWQNTPERWKLDPGQILTMTAGQKTDWFTNPNGGNPVANAPALLIKTREPFLLKAHVTVDFAATFDAGVLVIYQSAQRWAKLCLELSPEGKLMIVSVVTKEVSDDCNSVPVAGSSIYLRLAKLDRAFAFHYSLNGHTWNLVRHFALGGSAEVEAGFLVQSPIGNGCTATFREIEYLSQKLVDIRSGD